LNIVCDLLFSAWDLPILSVVNWEEGGDDVRSAWPFDALGYTRGTMDSTMGR